MKTNESNTIKTVVLASGLFLALTTSTFSADPGPLFRLEFGIGSPNGRDVSLSWAAFLLRAPTAEEIADWAEHPATWVIMRQRDDGSGFSKLISTDFPDDPDIFTNLRSLANSAAVMLHAQRVAEHPDKYRFPYCTGTAIVLMTPSAFERWMKEQTRDFYTLYRTRHGTPVAP